MDVDEDQDKYDDYGEVAMFVAMIISFYCAFLRDMETVMIRMKTIMMNNYL